MNINAENTIYYGTSIEYIYELDSIGMTKPRYRNEQHISVCISGYASKYELGHEDLKEFGRVYTEVLNVASVKNNRLCFKDGYHNSMTYIEGFGPNPSPYLRSFYGLVKNVKTENTMTAVISPEYIDELVKPDKTRTFEYLSLALHGFLDVIRPEMICAWIVPDKHYSRIMSEMCSGKLKSRTLISDANLPKQVFDKGNVAKYGSHANDIEMYIKNLNGTPYYREAKIEHLKSILSGVGTINWESNNLEDEILEWYRANCDKVEWEPSEYKFIYR